MGLSGYNFPVNQSKKREISRKSGDSPRQMGLAGSLTTGAVAVFGRHLGGRHRHGTAPGALDALDADVADVAETDVDGCKGLSIHGIYGIYGGLMWVNDGLIVITR